MPVAFDPPTIAAETPLQQTVRLLRRQWRKIFLASLLGAVVAMLGGVLIEPTYSAKAEIVVQPQPAVAGQEAVILPADQDAAIVQTHLAALMSDEHLQAVLNSLAHEPRRLTEPVPVRGDPFGAVRTRLRGWLHDALAFVKRSLRGILPHHAAAGTRSRLAAFARHLHVFQERGSSVIAITFTATNPAAAALAANRVAQHYVDMLYRQKQENIARARAWIGRRIPEIQAEMERAESAVQDYRFKHFLPEDAQTDTVEQTLADLSRQLTAAQSALSARQTLLESLDELRRQGIGTDSVVQLLDSPALRDLQARERTLLQRQAQLAAQLGPTHPKARAVAAELASLHATLLADVARAADDLRAQAALAALRVTALQRRVAAARQRSNAARRAEGTLRDLEHGAAALRQVYSNLVQRREQLTERQEMISPDVRVLSLAPPPQRPSSPSPLLFTLPAFIAFAVIGCFVAIAGDRLDQGLRSMREVTEALGVPCVGQVPRLRRLGRLRPHQYFGAHPFSPYAEAIRSVLAALRRATPLEQPGVILVTSSVPGEGKTTLAVSVAACAAMLGRRAVLVNLDLRHPGVLREVGGSFAAPPPGGADAAIHAGGLSGIQGIQDIQGIPDLGIDLLTLHCAADNPLLPFARGELATLLGRLRIRYDTIVIDSPPLLSVAEARLAATLADKVLFVVQWGRTRRDLAQSAMALLRETCRLARRDGETSVAGVITQVDLPRHARYRYGDIGESLVRYADYYIQPGARARLGGPDHGARPLPPRDVS